MNVGHESSLTLRRLLVWTYEPRIRLKTLAALVDHCQGPAAAQGPCLAEGPGVPCGDVTCADGAVTPWVGRFGVVLGFPCLQAGGLPSILPSASVSEARSVCLLACACWMRVEVWLACVLWLSCV